MSGDKHHLYGPSSLERRMLCPGSARMEEGRPDVGSDAASEGSLLHAVMAGTATEDSLTDAQRSLVARCRDVLAELSADWTETHHEQRMRMFGLDYSELTNGTADVVGVAEDRVEIVDWKFGYMPVEATAENIQLATYAAMAMDLHGKARCIAHVVQPRLGRHDRFEFTNADAITATVAAIISRGRAPDAPLVPGEDQCRYCRAAVDCPAANGSLRQLAVVPDGDGSLTDLAPEQLCDLYELWKLAKRVGERLERRIRYVIEKEGVCGCLTVSRRSGARKIEDPGAAFLALNGGLAQDEFLGAVTVSVAKLEEAYIGKHAERTETGVRKRGEAKRLATEFAGLLGDLVSSEKDVESIVAVEQPALDVVEVAP